MSTTLPFIHRYISVRSRSIDRDEITSEDTLAAIVAMTADDIVRERATRVTDVRHETTDDQ
jgi:hypothetical protein